MRGILSREKNINWNAHQAHWIFQIDIITGVIILWPLSVADRFVIVFM